MKAEDAMLLIGAEFHSATKKFGEFASPHEGYAIIKEEVDELWDEVKANNRAAQIEEAIQVGAMAMRFLVDMGVTDE